MATSDTVSRNAPARPLAGVEPPEVTVRQSIAPPPPARDERGLREHDARIRQSLEAGRMGTWEWDVASGRVSWSPGLEAIHGLAPGTFGGTFEAYLADVHPEDRDRVVSQLKQVIEHGNEHLCQYRLRLPDGSVRWVEGRGAVFRDASGRATAMSGLCIDVTDRRRTEQRLAAEHAVTLALAGAGSYAAARAPILAALCEHLGGAYAVAWEFDEKGERLVWRADHESGGDCEPFASTTRGYTFARGVGLPGRVWAAGEPAFIEELAADSNFPRGPVAAEAGLRSGAAFPVIAGGRVIGVIEWFSRDRMAPDTVLRSTLTAMGVEIGQFMQREATEELLREREERLRLLFEQAAVGIKQIDASGRYMDVNSRFCEMVGFSKQDLVGRADLDLTHADDVAGEARLHAALFAGEISSYVVEKRYVHRDDRLVWVRVTASMARPSGAGRQYRVAIVEDITERRAAEEALRRSEALYRAVAESVNYGVWVCDEQGRCIYASPSFLALLGMTMEQCAGWGWIDAVHPEDVPATRAAWDACVHAGGAWEREHRLMGADGAWHCVLARGVPIRDERGRIQCWAGINLDIDALKRTERALKNSNERLEESVLARTRELEESHRRLRLSERMAALGTLSAGIGHDMGNLLLPIRARVESLERAGLPERLREDVAAIGACSEYLQRLARGLRLLSLDPANEPEGEESIVLAEWWRDVVPMMRSTIPRTVRLEGYFPADLPRARMARHQLTQVVFNLVQNAGHATRDRGDGQVRVEARPAAGGGIELRVIDNGRGMSEEVATHCLEPFFSTKTRSLSTGLGLSLVAGIVERAGGTIEIESAVNRGTTFIIRLRPGAGPPGAPENLGRARVCVSNPRTAGLVRSILKGLRVEADGEHPDAAILVCDRSAEEQAGAFIAGGASRRAVVIGGESGPGIAGVPEPARVGDIRDALRDAVRECYGAPGAVHG